MAIVPQPSLICPRCNQKYPADFCSLSRKDSLTLICSDCGMKESMEDLGMGIYCGPIYWSHQLTDTLELKP